MLNVEIPVSIIRACLCSVNKFPSKIIPPLVWRFNTFKFQPVHYAACELKIHIFKIKLIQQHLCVLKNFRCQ